ncbi:MAG: transcription antitermination factor NusB [Alphaproteobacteria bacterium]|nr:transcription antitermination factor NusB [Alphaproteobacteria bacterium]
MQRADNPRRAAARLAAVQALYQMETAGAGVESVILEFNAHRFGGDPDSGVLHDADTEFFADIIRGVIELQRRIDTVIERHLADKWRLGRLDATARAILRAGAYELIRREDVPFRVVIDEYVEIANSFFDGEEPKFVNAVLDGVARETRREKTAG